MGGSNTTPQPIIPVPVAIITDAAYSSVKSPKLEAAIATALAPPAASFAGVASSEGRSYTKNRPKHHANHLHLFRSTADKGHNA